MSEEPQSPVLPPGPGARCAIHPDLPAEATCSRCGNFTCSRCIDLESAAGLCLACRARVGHSGRFPYSREHWSLDGLISLSLARYKQHWRVLVPFCGVGLIVLYAVSFAGAYLVGKLAAGTQLSTLTSIGRQVGLQLALNVLQLAFELSSFGLCLDALEGRPVSVSTALARLRRFPAALLQLLVSLTLLGLFVGLAGAVIWLGGMQRLWIVGLTAIVALPVGAYLALGLSFAQIALVGDPDATALSALRDSWAIVRGQRWVVLGVGFVAGLLAFAGVLGCGVGVIATLPLGLLLYGALYLALKTPTSVVGAEHQALASPQWHV